ncbi:MAG TPA: phosphatase PAP2 family protein [Acidocella sp.]|jgi:membrane-associated phospholipid phosphatase|nr:phosphatase PAP2 family protein [Acidocella sp.]
MRYLSALALLAAFAAPAAQAQTAANLNALRGLVPFSTLLNSSEGKAALEENGKTTTAIQTGTSHQPSLEPAPFPREQSIRDAFITFANATQLADGLGTTLGAAYQKRATYSEGKDKPGFTSVSPNVALLLAYSIVVAESDSNSAKYFFANGTQKSSKNPPQPASAAALEILKNAGGTTDVFGKFFGLPAGGKGADRLGDSRPFQTAKYFATFAGKDYFGHYTSNAEWLRGPGPDSQSKGANLQDNPAFPSGHATYAYTGGVLLAIMVPQRYPQEITRAAEFGNGRIILGAHYAMDVIAGRTLALYDVAQLLSNNPDYVGQKEGKSPSITDYKAALTAARADLVKALESGTGTTIAEAATKDTSRFAHPATNEAFYESTQTYGLPVVFPAQAGKTEDVGKLAPEAGLLLTAAFPYLTLEQADDILTKTEGPGGGFLDNGSSFGLYSRLDLYKASLQAEALAPKSGD